MEKKEIKICFSARPFARMVLEICKEIKEEKLNAEFSFIVSNEEELKGVRDVFPETTISVWEVSSFMKEHWDEFTFERFVEYEKEYECAPIWKYIYTDRFLVNMDYDYCVKTTVGLFAFYEKIFKDNDIDFYYDETIATLETYVGYIVGKKIGVQYINQMTARGGLDATYHYFLNEPFQMNMLFNEDYFSQEYSAEERKRADEYLSEFENRDIKPANMVFTSSMPKFSLRFFFLPIDLFKAWLNPYSRDYYFYMYYKRYELALEPFKLYYRYTKSKKYYKKADYTKKYVYYPLHYEPEAATLVCAQKYEKQLFYIDAWAKSLPADTLLYVKEHYAVLGHRDLNFYRELQKYPNVVLIDPLENSRTLMQNAEAVTTLTGTAGYEAMLLRKPVFLGGQIFFSNAPGIIKSTEIFDNYVDLMKAWKRPDREDVIRYLCELFRTYYDGNVYCAGDACYESSNIKNITISLYNQLVKQKEEKEWK